MKTTFYFLFVLIVLLNYIPSIAQETEKTILIIPAIGDTLDKEERDYYSLLPNVKDFEWAIFYIDENRSVDVNVCTKFNDKLEFHFYQNYMSGLQNINHYLEQRDRLSATTPGGQEITIYKTDGSEIKGELVSVRQNSILVFPVPGGISLIDDKDLITVIQLQNISKMEIANTRPFLANCLLSYVAGALLGALLGYLVALPFDEDYIILTVPIGALVVGLVSYFIFSSDTDEYEVSADFDLNDIREYARFISFEPMYLRQIK